MIIFTLYKQSHVTLCCRGVKRLVYEWLVWGIQQGTAGTGLLEGIIWIQCVTGIAG